MQRALPLLLILLVGCTGARPAERPAPDGVFFTGAGDIAQCGSPGADATARLLDGIPGTIWTTGDNAYPSGSAEDFAFCFDPTWGRHRNRIRPTPGNHEYWTPGARSYFAYFGPAAGEAGKGWYAFEYGGWGVIALNSNVQTWPGSEQVEWLRRRLVADPHRCTVAYFHHPLVSSGAHGENADGHDDADVRALWVALQEARVEMVLVGHDHHYERFAPVNARGEADLRNGIRQFIVGTGGGDLRGPGPDRHPASRFFEAETHGVLRLELRSESYRWEFIDVDGAVLDSGEAACH